MFGNENERTVGESCSIEPLNYTTWKGVNVILL